MFSNANFYINKTDTKLLPQPTMVKSQETLTVVELEYVNPQKTAFQLSYS